MLAFYAHPDDADVSCGATLALWASRGAKVVVVICAKGEKGTVDASVSPNELEIVRKLEVSEAQKILGITDIIELSIPDGEIVNSLVLRSQLVGFIRDFKPSTVLCPDPTAVFFGSEYFNHRDHRELGWAVLDSVSPASALPHYFPGQGNTHQVSTVLMSGSLDPDVYVDISETISLKLDAVLSHKTQIGERGDLMREIIVGRSQETGRSIGVDAAEAFRILKLGS